MSSVENLNKVFLELCEDLNNVVSGFEEYIENARKRIQENPSTKYYLEYYFRHCLPYADKITSCEESGLLDMNILHGVKFGDVYKRNFPITSKTIFCISHKFEILLIFIKFTPPKGLPYGARDVSNIFSTSRFLI